jgi:two-component system, LytTR family, response regulator LytT
MKALIIEDELPAARQLTKLLNNFNQNITIIEVLDSVEASVKWLQIFPSPDVIFMDIQIADGLSFDIFNQTEISCPVVFTTAFDQYAIKAFKVNAIDYLLKPIDEDELATVIQKIQNRKAEMANQAPPQYTPDFLNNLFKNTIKTDYKERFLVKIGQNYTPIDSTDIAYFFSEDSITQFYTFSNKKYIVDYALDELESQLNPKYFFRINRKIIVNAQSIQKISPYFNGRLKLELTPVYTEDVYVARERVNDFKLWLGA